MSSVKRKASQASPTSPTSSSVPVAASAATTSTVQSSASKDKEREKKRTKVQVACVFCKRSHMVCSNERPCERCVRRGIQHLCTDLDPSTTVSNTGPDGTAGASSSTTTSNATTSSSSSNTALSTAKKSSAQPAVKLPASSLSDSNSSGPASSASPPPQPRSRVNSSSRPKNSPSKSLSKSQTSQSKRPHPIKHVSSSSSINELPSSRRRSSIHQAPSAGLPPYLPPVLSNSMGADEDQFPSNPQEDRVFSLQQQQSDTTSLPEMRQHQQRNPLNKAFPPQSIAHQLQSKHNMLSSQPQTASQSYSSTQRPSFSPQIAFDNTSGEPKVGQPDRQQFQSLLTKATSLPDSKPLQPPSPDYPKPITRSEDTMIDPSLAPSPLGMTPIASPWNGIGALTPRTSESLGVRKDKISEDLSGNSLVPTLASGSGYKDAEWGSLSEFLNTLEFPSSLLPASSNNSTSFPSPSQSAAQLLVSNPSNATAASPSFYPSNQQHGSFNDLLNQLYKSYQDQHKINLEALQARVSRPASPTHFPHHFHPHPPPSNSQAPGQPSTQHPSTQTLSFPPDEAHHPFHQQSQPSQQQQQQQLNPNAMHHKDEDTQHILPGGHSQLQPVPSLAVGDHLHAILRAKFESSQLVSASEGWDWELGWSKLESWMDATISEASKERISAPLRIFRPTVREILASLSKEEKILIEEGFQRLVLQMDRCFTVVRTPSLFWRRTGQIFKANNEFANLMGIDINWFKDGKLGIYELMTEDSAVNFWEQYCAIGFDTSRKAVLTTCTLCPPARLLKRNAAALAAAAAANAMSGSNSNAGNSADNNAGSSGPSSAPALRRPGKEISCCFSFTVIRDQWGIPLGVSGQVMRI